MHYFTHFTALSICYEKIHIVWSLVFRCIICILKVKKSNLKDYYKYFVIYSILFAVSFALLILFNCL